MTPPTGAGQGQGAARRPGWLVALLLLVATLGGACSSELVGSATSSTAPAAASATASTTTTLAGEVSVAFPVAACTTAYGTPLPGNGWKASILLAPIPTSLVGRVEFYTDGPHSVLGPSGWSCVESTVPDGATALSVEPTGASSTAPSGEPAPGTEGVFAVFDTTGSPAGAALVCPYFTIPQWQQREADCNGQKPPGELANLPTSDVASVLDPAGVTGTLPASGGPRAVTGTVIFPQVMPAVTDGSSIAVAVESCSLVAAALCPTVLADFDVREFPVPTANGGYG